MGKKNFKDLYRRIKSEFGSVSCKTSYFCDKFNASSNYAGAIIYSIDGKFKWENQEGGKANGFKGRSFYIIIQCTDDWPVEHLKAAGQGRVHDYLLKNVMGIEYDQDRIACGGFAYVNGELRFSSVWLNGRSQTGAESDGNKMLSDLEKVLVTHCFEEYKKHGGNHAFSVPSCIDRILSN
ncbi:unnamed protein product [Rotaria socialis]|uniref:Uncharacterized protein n=1 Tax=Rotaria socialis TaxID=392032 RepID=A0A821GW05_9BILA|nr:unnamed protein product [Rotaria socialis]CAF4673434.1 unnamed protein product [Rotaria socialis]